MFFDADDMEKFADEGTMDDDGDLEGERLSRCGVAVPPSGG